VGPDHPARAALERSFTGQPGASLGHRRARSYHPAHRPVICPWLAAPGLGSLFSQRVFLFTFGPNRLPPRASRLRPDSSTGPPARLGPAKNDMHHTGGTLWLRVEHRHPLWTRCVSSGSRPITFLPALLTSLRTSGVSVPSATQGGSLRRRSLGGVKPAFAAATSRGRPSAEGSKTTAGGYGPQRPLAFSWSSAKAPTSSESERQYPPGHREPHIARPTRSTHRVRAALRNYVD
jgi:hypothetical protein